MNVYQIVTQRIMEQLKKGVIPWRKPWVEGLTTLISFPDRGQYGNAAYRGNCSGLDTFRHNPCIHISIDERT